MFFRLTLIALLAFCLLGQAFAAGRPEGSADSYRIGVYATLTGTGATVGDQQMKGIQVALQEINAAGGIKGRPLELIVYDDAGTPEGAVRAVTRLVESDRVDVIAGGHLSPNIIATIPYTEPEKILQIGAGAGVTWTNAGHQYLFRATSNAGQYINTFVDKMVEMGERTTAIISLETEFGQSSRRAALDTFAGTNIRILAEATYQATETDFTGQISRLLAPNPDSVVMLGNSWEMALILRQLRQQGFNKFVYTLEGGASTDIVRVGGEFANGLIFSCAYIIPERVELAADEVMRSFLERYVAMHNELPVSDTAFRGYDQMRLIGIALNNTTDIRNRDANRDAFLRITNHRGLAGVFDFSPNTGDGLSQANAYMIYNQVSMAFDRATMERWRAAQR